MYNEFDDLMPNTQTPRRKPSIGSANNPWYKGYMKHIVLAGITIEPYNVVQVNLTEPLAYSYIITHNFGTQFVDIQIYDTNKNVVQPDSIVVIDNNNIKISFVEPQGGTALIQRGKII